MLMLLTSENPLVSVIITNYNYSRYLGEAIKSVLSQTYDNFEIIIVDDGSTDNSLEIIGQYCRESPEKIIPISKENGGQASAFNAGFMASKGEIISFLDSDDYWMPTRLEKVVYSFREGIYSIVQHNMEFTDERSRKLGRLYRHGLFTGDAKKMLLEYCHLDLFVPTSGICFKRAGLEQILPMPEKWKICADAYLTRIALFYGQLYSFEEPLGYYRVHGNNNWMHTAAQQKSKDVATNIVNSINEFLSNKGFNERVNLRNNPSYWSTYIREKPTFAELFFIARKLPGFPFIGVKEKAFLLLKLMIIFLEWLKSRIVKALYMTRSSKGVIAGLFKK